MPAAGTSPSATAIEAIRPPSDLPLAQTGRPELRASAASNAARQTSRRTASGSGDLRPASMYGKLNRSVARPSPTQARANPTRNGWSMPAPAPCATTRVANGSGGAANRAETGPRAVPIVSDDSASAIACHHASDDRHPPPGHLGVLVRRLEARRVLSGGPEEPRDALLLLATAVVGRDQLHVPTVPDREVAHVVAGRGGRRLPVYPEGQTADHPLQTAPGHRRGRAGVPGARHDPRRQARIRAVPVPSEPALRPRPDRVVRRLPPAGAAFRDGVPAPVVGRGEGPPALAGHRVVRGRDGREGPRPRRPLVGAARLPQAPEDRVLRRGAAGLGRTDRARPLRRRRRVLLLQARGGRRRTEDGQAPTRGDRATRRRDPDRSGVRISRHATRTDPDGLAGHPRSRRARSRPCPPRVLARRTRRPPDLRRWPPSRGAHPGPARRRSG